MTYIRFFIIEGKIQCCHTSDMPIHANVMAFEHPTTVVCAEIDGEFVDSKVIMKQTFWDDEKVHGLSFIKQYVLGNFVPEPKTTEELAAQARAERDQLLAATDWTQSADVPQATKDKWVPYRQALRDVPQQDLFPEQIAWPVKPE